MNLSDNGALIKELKKLDREDTWKRPGGIVLGMTWKV